MYIYYVYKIKTKNYFSDTFWQIKITFVDLTLWSRFMHDFRVITKILIARSHKKYHSIFSSFNTKKLQFDISQLDLSTDSKATRYRHISHTKRLAEVPDDTPRYGVFIYTVCKCPRHNMARKYDKGCRWQRCQDSRSKPFSSMY